MVSLLSLVFLTRHFMMYFLLFYFLQLSSSLPKCQISLLNRWKIEACFSLVRRWKHKLFLNNTISQYSRFFSKSPNWMQRRMYPYRNNGCSLRFIWMGRPWPRPCRTEIEIHRYRQNKWGSVGVGRASAQVWHWIWISENLNFIVPDK